MAEINVQLEFTPNPETLKYLCSIDLLPAGAQNFASAEMAKSRSELAAHLFQFPEVSNVMIGKNFVTLTVKNQENLAQLNDGFVRTIREFLESGRKVVESANDGQLSKNLSEIEQKIVEILDAEIRPAVAMDGGDITFEKFEDGFVYLRMQGSCSGCPSSLMTLKAGVETRLKSAIPEIQEVIPV